MMVLLIGFFLLNSQSYGQNQPIDITWDGEVGCRKYLNENQKDFLESISNINDCARVCSGSTTNYTVTGSNIVSATWNVINGVVTASNNGLNASIQWIDQTGSPSQMASLIYVTVVKNDNTTEIFNLCAVILQSPNTLFDFNNGNHTVCTGSKVDFINLTNAYNATTNVSFQWEFGDGNYSNESFPSHTYNVPGKYQVSLTVSNECNCSSTYSIELVVLDKKTVVIDCPTVVCEGQVATYTVRNDCDGEWQVVGGTIINQDTDFIEVKWDALQGDASFGFVSYRAFCGCDAWTTVKVPVIKDAFNIQSVSNFCVNGDKRFSLPQWPSTDYVWTLDDDPNHPNLVLTDQRNEVAVIGDGGILKCTYTNTLTGCTGYQGNPSGLGVSSLTKDFYAPEFICQG